MFIKENRFTVLFLAGGAALMLYGLYRGEFREIFYKGIVLCLECMGLG